MIKIISFLTRNKQINQNLFFKFKKIQLFNVNIDKKIANINEQTFLLIMKRLQQKSKQAKQLQQKLNQFSSNNHQQSIKQHNSQLMRKKLNQIAPLVAVYQDILPIDNNINDLHQMLKQTSDQQQKKILQDQIKSLLDKKQQLKQMAIQQLIPPDSFDDVNQIYLELRPGAGGSESAVFVEDISQMFIAYAEGQGWRVSIINQIKQTVASKGFKYLRLKVIGQDCYKIMKCQSGVHKVIRVPETQSKGRLHSSTISMVVMPSIPFSFQVDNKDIKYQFTRSSGAGGQSINKTDSACRATHIPSGLSVFIQQQRCQDQNKKRATQLLKQRLFQIQYQKIITQQKKRRKSQIGTMDRSEKIRTYNYPQDRITDHRTGLTLFGIQNMMSGNLLQKFIDSYINKQYEEKLQALMEELKEGQKLKGIIRG